MTPPYIGTWGRAAKLALVGLTSAALLFSSASRADAGVYKMYSCNVPGRETPVPSTAPWTATLDGLNTLSFDNCASGGAFGIGLNQAQRFMRPGTSAGLALTLPTTGPKASIGVVRYRTWVTGELAGSGAPAFVSDGGALSPPGGSMVWDSPTLANVTNAIYVQLYCSTGGGGAPCSFQSAWPLQVAGIETDLFEDVAPSGSFEGGTLLSGSAQSGIRTLRFNATDLESGIARVELLLGGTLVATRDLTDNRTVCAHVGLNACPPRLTDHLSVDTSLVPPGDYVVSLRISDAAGNQRRQIADHRVSIARASSAPAPPSAAPAPPFGTPRLLAAFATSRATHVTDYGRSVRIRGRLTDAAGAVMPRARIAVVEQANARLAKRKTSYVETSGDGRFDFVASGRRPSRVLDLRYFARQGDAAPVASRRLRLFVRAGSTFKVSLRGIRVRYSGRILSGAVPKRGVRVYVQGRAAGGAWRRFAVRATNSKGKFSGRYRLRVRRPGVQLQFRVEIPKQKGYPFARGLGKAHKRTVR